MPPLESSIPLSEFACNLPGRESDGEGSGGKTGAAIASRVFRLRPKWKGGEASATGRAGGGKSREVAHEEFVDVVDQPEAGFDHVLEDVGEPIQVQLLHDGGEPAAL